MNDDVQHDYFQFRPDYPTDPAVTARRNNQAALASQIPTSPWAGHRLDNHDDLDDEEGQA